MAVDPKVLIENVVEDQLPTLSPAMRAELAQRVVEGLESASLLAKDPVNELLVESRMRMLEFFGPEVLLAYLNSGDGTWGDYFEMIDVMARTIVSGLPLPLPPMTKPQPPSEINKGQIKPQ